MDAEGPGETVVSFTFDGSSKGQDAAAQILADNDMAGTFFVVSGYIGYAAFLSIDQLRSISRDHSEIGGASLYGNDLSRQSPKRVRSEICNDRATLTRLGFQVTSFANPYGTRHTDGRASSRSAATTVAGTPLVSSSPRAAARAVPPMSRYHPPTCSGSGRTRRVSPCLP